MSDDVSSAHVVQKVQRQDVTGGCFGIVRRMLFDAHRAWRDVIQLHAVILNPDVSG